MNCKHCGTELVLMGYDPPADPSMPSTSRAPVYSHVLDHGELDADHEPWPTEEAP